MKWIALISLLLCGCNSQSFETTVLIIGDSISLGYTPYVQQELDGKYVVFHSEGNPSNSNNDQGTAYALEHLNQWLKDAGPIDIIHANWGLWDIHGFGSFVGTTPEEYRANLEAIASILDKTGAKIILATTTPTPINSLERTDAQVQEYNSILIQVAQEHGYEVDDLYSYILPYQYLHLNDSNVHYTQEGYKLLSYQVSQSIESECCLASSK